jgi:hypothetical protein
LILPPFVRKAKQGNNTTTKEKEEGHFVAVRNDVPFDSFDKQSSTHAHHSFFSLSLLLLSSFLSSSIFPARSFTMFRSPRLVPLQSLKV